VSVCSFGSNLQIIDAQLLSFVIQLSFYLHRPCPISAFARIEVI
jgi:hypothetical protein